jgi:hypothetical protein
MALNGINGGGSALERFQALRDSAKKKIDVADGQTGLADLIKKKQIQLGSGGSASPLVPGNAAKSPAERILSGLGAANPSASAPTGYGRAGGLQKPDSRPTLGRHVDFMA